MLARAMFKTVQFLSKMFNKSEKTCRLIIIEPLNFFSLCKCSWRVWCMLYVCRCWRIYHSGGSGDDLSHRKTAEETLRHRLPGVWTQHHTGFHQTGALKLQGLITIKLHHITILHCQCVITLSVLLSEIPRTRHSQGPSSDDEEGWTAAPHAEEGSLPGQVERCCVIVSHTNLSAEPGI